MNDVNTKSEYPKLLSVKIDLMNRNTDLSKYYIRLFDGLNYTFVYTNGYCDPSFNAQNYKYNIYIDHIKNKVSIYVDKLDKFIIRKLYTIKNLSINKNNCPIDVYVFDNETVYENDIIRIEKCNFISIGNKYKYISSGDSSIYLVERYNGDKNRSINEFDIYRISDDEREENKFILSIINTIDTMISSEEIKDVVAMYNANQLTKQMSIFKDTLSELK